MTFDRQKYKTFLQGLPEGEQATSIPLHWFNVLDSTNRKLWELLDRGSPLPAIAIAGQQTAGRGQRGRTWHSPPGGLYLSFALAPELSAQNSDRLILCSAWGLASALRRDRIPVALKWPNDLILNGRKLGGIKIETRSQGGKIAQAVIGVGLNWTNPVPEPGINLHTFFSDRPTSRIADLESLAALAVAGLWSGYQYYCREGIDSLLSRYQELLSHQGRPVYVDGCLGVVAGIEPTGAIRIRLDRGDRTVEICRRPGTISLGYDNDYVNFYPEQAIDSH